MKKITDNLNSAKIEVVAETECTCSSYILDYINTFLGYGNPLETNNSGKKLWFIGMEEGGGKSIADVCHRIDIWRKRGSRKYEDLKDFHVAIGQGDYFFCPKTKFQITWAALIRIILRSKNCSTNEPCPSLSTISSEDIKKYQCNLLGRSNGDHCLLELMPLPSVSINDWIYGECNMGEIRTREDYYKKIQPIRIRILRELIIKSKPEVVVCYGISQWKIFQKLTKATLKKKKCGRYDYYHGYESALNLNFLVINHPNARGISKEYFEQIGCLVKPWL